MILYGAALNVLILIPSKEAQNTQLSLYHDRNWLATVYLEYGVWCAAVEAFNQGKCCTAQETISPSQRSLAC